MQLGKLSMSHVVEAIDSSATPTRYAANMLTNPFLFENVQQKASPLNLEKPLAYSRYFNAADDRDRFFAILGHWEQALGTQNCALSCTAGLSTQRRTSQHNSRLGYDQ
jgi:hypothetical protein